MLSRPTDIHGVRFAFGLPPPCPTQSSKPARELAALFLAKDAYGMLQGPESSQIAHSAHLGGALLGAVWVGLRRL